MKRAWALLFSLALIAAILYAQNPASAQSGTIHLFPDPETVGPGAKVRVLIADGDLDASSNRIDEYDAADIELVTFRTDRSELEEASPDLKETGKNTGIFEFFVQLKTDDESCDAGFFADPSFAAVGGSNPSIGVCPGDILSIGYDDFYDAAGEEAAISYYVEIKSWDPEFATDKVSDVGDTITIVIIDFDANRNPDIRDSIRNIRVYSDSDIVGRDLSAIETDRNTGIFQLTFTTSSESQGNAIRVRESDSLSIEYIDEFPADFTLDERTNTFTMTLDAIMDEARVIPSIPHLSSSGPPAAGNQVELLVTVTSESNRPQQFIQLIEVRDSTGVTVFLAWQSGIIDPSSQTNVGVTWTPENPGNYVIRTFAINNLENPQVLSLVQESEYTIV